MLVSGVQIHQDGLTHPIAFASKALAAPEKNYSIANLKTLAVVWINLETLTVVWAVSHYYAHLYGHDVEVRNVKVLLMSLKRSLSVHLYPNFDRSFILETDASIRGSDSPRWTDTSHSFCKQSTGSTGEELQHCKSEDPSSCLDKPGDPNSCLSSKSLLCSFVWSRCWSKNRNFCI